jgi:hypothetical protein
VIVSRESVAQSRNTFRYPTSARVKAPDFMVLFGYLRGRVVARYTADHDTLGSRNSCPTINLMTTFRPPVLLALAVLCIPSSAGAVTLHSFFDRDCNVQTGILAHVNETHVSIVDTTGHHRTVSRTDIASVVLHKTLENPLSTLHTNSPLRQHLRQVWLGDDRQPSFTGWATDFFDALFIFVDLQGKLHVLDPEEIGKIRLAHDLPDTVQIAAHAEARLRFPPEIVRCGKAESERGITPTRVIADQIKIGDYLTALGEQYHSIEGFEERTYVYPFPFVYDDNYRIGLTYFENSAFPFPFYFRWSNGRPYRFQSLTTMGNTPQAWLPVLGPTFSASSDIKSHFFTASFVGNIIALPAGNNPYEFFSELKSGGPKHQLATSYNYLALMGVDFWRLSLAAGPGYLTYQFRTPQATRTILANNMSPTVRALYRGHRVEGRLLYYRSRLSDDVQPDAFDDVGTPEQPNVAPTQPGTRPPRVGSFIFKADTVRAGATIKFPWGIRLVVDEILVFGRHRETVSGTTAQVDFTQALTGIAVAADFDRYVTVKGYANFVASWFSPTGGATESNLTQQFGGALEFVF